MKIFVDPQGNFQEATKYHEELAKKEPSIFRIYAVSEESFLSARSQQLAGTNVNYINGVFVATSKSFSELAREKLSLINKWTKNKIIGGFVSTATGESVTFDSDEETQSTMQTMHTATLSPDFATHPVYQGHIPVRGYAEGETEKTVFYLTAEQVLKFMSDLALHIGTCKQEGWVKQSLVASATSVEELNAIILD